jgi:hypothetical protein
MHWSGGAIASVLWDASTTMRFADDEVCRSAALRLERIFHRLWNGVGRCCGMLVWR